MWMRERRLVSEAGWCMGAGNKKHPVVMAGHERIVANRIGTVITQPVIHAKTKQGAITNHLESTLPQIQALGQCADTQYALVTIQKINNGMTKHNTARSQRYHQPQAA